MLAAAGRTAQYSAMDTVAAYRYQWVGRAHYLAIHDLHLADGETFSDASTVDRRRDRRCISIPIGWRRNLRKRCAWGPLGPDLLQ